MSTLTFQDMGDGLLELARRIQRLGWPAMLACALVVAACACLAAAWFASHQILQVHAATASMRQAQKTPVNIQAAAVDTLAPAPDDAQFLDDLKAIFALAKKSGIALGVVDYKTERSDKLPLTMRSIELKVKEDYPKVKGFLSQVLADFAHASLQEIRVERTDGMATQGTLLIHLLLVYKSAGNSADAIAAAPVTTKQTP